MSRMFTLYRVFDDQDALLYVGATVNISRRIGQHSYDHSPWWPRASRIELQRFATFEELTEAEGYAIEFERPEYNLAHTGRSTSRSKPRRSPGTGSLYQRSNGAWVGAVNIPARNGQPARRVAVSSKDRAEAQRKFDLLKAQAGIK